MIKDLVLMNGYGLFVWSSFAITFLTCAVVYYKTRKTLKKYEKRICKKLMNFLLNKKVVLESSKIASKVLSSYNKTF